VELGPEGGEEGGLLVAEGPPAQVASVASPTGEVLRALFAEHGLKVPGGTRGTRRGPQVAARTVRKR
jgi:excinuclease ABC subunit A